MTDLKIEYLDNIDRHDIINYIVIFIDYAVEHRNKERDLLIKDLNDIDINSLLTIYDIFRLNLNKNLVEKLSIPSGLKRILIKSTNEGKSILTLNKSYVNSSFRLINCCLSIYIIVPLYLLIFIIKTTNADMIVTNDDYKLDFLFTEFIKIFITINLVFLISIIFKNITNINYHLTGKFTIIVEACYKHMCAVNYSSFKNYKTMLITYYNNDIHKKTKTSYLTYDLLKSNIVSTKHIGLLLKNNDNIYLYDLTRFGIKLTKIKDDYDFKYCQYKSIFDPFINNINFSKIIDIEIEKYEYNSCYTFIYFISLLYPKYNYQTINIFKIIFVIPFFYNIYDYILMKIMFYHS